jgi:hypothetical protein
MWKSPLSAKFSRPFLAIVPPSSAGFASFASDAGGLLWRKLERSKSLVLLQVGDLTCRWQRHSAKPSCWDCSTIVEQAETQLRVVVPIEEEEEDYYYYFRINHTSQHLICCQNFTFPRLLVALGSAMGRNFFLFPKVKGRVLGIWVLLLLLLLLLILLFLCLLSQACISPVLLFKH